MELFLTWAPPPPHTHTYIHYAMENNVPIMKNAVKFTTIQKYTTIPKTMEL